MIELLTVILAFLMLIATAVYVYYTKQLVKETIKMREIEISPFIGAHIDLHSGLSTIVIKNIGKAPAYDLEIEFEKDKLKEIRNGICRESIGINKSKIKYFGVSQEILLPFSTQKLFDREIILTLKYKSKENQAFEENITLGLKSEKDMNVSYYETSVTSNLKKINDELKNIGKHLEKLTKI